MQCIQTAAKTGLKDGMLRAPRKRIRAHCRISAGHATLSVAQRRPLLHDGRALCSLRQRAAVLLLQRATRPDRCRHILRCLVSIRHSRIDHGLYARARRDELAQTQLVERLLHEEERALQHDRLRALRRWQRGVGCTQRRHCALHTEQHCCKHHFGT